MGFRSARCTFALKVSSIIHWNVRITEQAAASLRRQNTIKDAHREMHHNLHRFGGAASTPKYKRTESLPGWLSQFHPCTQLHFHKLQGGNLEIRFCSSGLTGSSTKILYQSRKKYATIVPIVIGNVASAGNYFVTWKSENEREEQWKERGDGKKGIEDSETH